MRRDNNSRGRRGRGSARDRPYDDSRDHHGASRSVKTFEGIPILFPPSAKEHDAMRNGIQKVKETLSLYFARYYGHYGRFIANDEYFDEPVPDPPEQPFDPDNQAVVIQWRAYEAACIEVAKNKVRMNNETVSWFSTIVSILSPASKNLVEAEDEWDEVNQDQDPLELWRLVERTHLTRVTGSTDIDRNNAMEAYNRVRHQRNEDLSDYKKRQEIAVQTLERVEHPNIPDERMQVVKWISGLNDSYREWRVKTLNAMKEGTNPPASIEEAMRHVTNYVSVLSDTSGRADENPRNAFATQGRNKRGNKSDNRSSFERNDSGHASDLCSSEREELTAMAATGKGAKRSNDKNKPAAGKPSAHEDADEGNQSPGFNKY